MQDPADPRALEKAAGDLLAYQRPETGAPRLFETVHFCIALTSVRHLAQLLKGPSGQTILTTIQKFEEDLTREGKRQIGVPLHKGSNVIVLIDEARRTEYGVFNARLRDALPEACFIAFTGTPIPKTLAKFGSYIHRYTMPTSVADGATVPTAAEYLERAYGTARAYYEVPINIRMEGGWTFTGWVDWQYIQGNFHEKYLLPLIAALEAEGQQAKADYTNATRLFGEVFITAPATDSDGEGGGAPGPIKVEARGIAVEILDGGISLVAEVDGKAMPVSVADYKVKLASALLQEAPDLPAFITRWIDPQRRQELINHLPESGNSAEKIRIVSEMDDYDLYDVLAQLAYQAPARTRLHRVEAFASANVGWLAGHGQKTEAVLLALVHQFVENGTDGLELLDLFDVPSVKRAGGLAALEGHDDPKQLLMETKRRLFVA